MCIVVWRQESPQNFKILWNWITPATQLHSSGIVDADAAFLILNITNRLKSIQCHCSVVLWLGIIERRCLEGHSWTSLMDVSTEKKIKSVPLYGETVLGKDIPFDCCMYFPSSVWKCKSSFLKTKWFEGGEGVIFYPLFLDSGMKWRAYRQIWVSKNPQSPKSGHHETNATILHNQQQLFWQSSEVVLTHFNLLECTKNTHILSDSEPR
jgi:hypothetical protein